MGHLCMDGQSLEHWNAIKANILKKPVRKVQLDEVSRHNSPDDAWIVLFGVVFDITLFIKYHPGGLDPVREFLGKDGSSAFGKL